MDQVTVHVEAEINPTESEERVKRAVANLFGELPVEVKPAAKGSILTAEGKGQNVLIPLRDALCRDHIRDASRKPLYQGSRDNIITFYLNKQVAFAGHVSFSQAEGESPLGPIKVTVECENPPELINWLAPRTAKS
jgi:predicted RNA binding protein with dsRBD fold (UPF0201 family)